MLRIVIPFEGTLTRASNGAPVVGRKITFLVGGRPGCIATTNAQGSASCRATLPSLVGVVLSLGYTGVFDGDGQYHASSGRGNLVR